VTRPPYFFFGGPKPSWPMQGRTPLLVTAEHFVLPPLSYISVPLAPLFPPGGFVDPAGFPYPAQTIGPYPEKRWVYSHADNPAVADDDFYFNGEPYEANNFAGPINGGATTLILVLPAGGTFTVRIWNAGGSYGASGELRLYTRPLM
jgi:hypothetical protein